MKVPANKLLKRDLVWLFENTCEAHSTNYASHYACFLSEQPSTAPFSEKIGFLDIETSNLNATFGYVISYCIKALDGPIYEYCISGKELRTFRFDEILLKNLVKDMERFDRFIVFWGKDRRFDIPFIRTRCIKWGIPFPLWKEHIVYDLWDACKNKLRLHNNRLVTACEFFGIPAKGHKLTPEVWHKAQQGHKDSLAYILEHNREDVESTEALWKILEPFVNMSKASI